MYHVENGRTVDLARARCSPAGDNLRRVEDLRADYARGTPEALGAFLAAGAAKVRPWTGRPRNEAQERRQTVQRETRCFLRGRVTKIGSVAWDVFETDGRELRLYFRGAPSEEEALEIANHCLSGRVMASISGARAILAGTRSGLLAPARGMQRRIETEKTEVASRLVEVKRKPPAEKKPA